MRLFLIRHGQTDWNEAGRAQGHTDIPLNAEGRSQAERLGASLAQADVVRVLCSDLGRCRETAAPLLAVSGAAVEYRADLRERSFGDWEGDSFWEVGARQEAAMAKGKPFVEVRPPNGESFVDVWHRLDRVVDQIFSLEETTAVVCHGGTCAVLLARLLQGTPTTIRSFRFGNTAVTELERRPEGAFLMLRYADTEHLLVPAAVRA